MFELYLGEELEFKTLDKMVANSTKVTQVKLLCIEPAWDGLTLYAQWRSFGDATAIWTPIENEYDAIFTVPNQVLTNCKATIYMSIYGKDLENHVVKITPWAFMGVVQPGADPGPENPDDPPLPDDHRALTHREDPDQHPIEAITGLSEEIESVRTDIDKTIEDFNMSSAEFEQRIDEMLIQWKEDMNEQLATIEASVPRIMTEEELRDILINTTKSLKKKG